MAELVATRRCSAFLCGQVWKNTVLGQGMKGNAFRWPHHSAFWFLHEFAMYPPYIVGAWQTQKGMKSLDAVVHEQLSTRSGLQRCLKMPDTEQPRAATGLTLASRSISCADAAWNRRFQSRHSASDRMRSHKTKVLKPCRNTFAFQPPCS